MPAAARRMMRARPTNRPATFPVLDQNPFALALAGRRLGVSGGAVGVMVTVRSSPVTVMTLVTGVGDQVDVWLVVVDV